MLQRLNLPDRELEPVDLELIDQRAAEDSRQSFWAYRQFMNPTMHVGWWQREVAMQLHRFWLEYLAGRRPKLLLQSPPQHGKSITVIDFLSWIIGQAYLIGRKDIKIIFASFSDRLGIRANLRLQRLLFNPKHRAIFGPVLDPLDRQNTDMIKLAFGEHSNEHGYFRNTTIAGQVTGEGLDIGCIDDPIKGRAEASSINVREKTWNWLTDDFISRFSDRAGLLMIMCLTGDTQVAMADGSWKPLERVAVNDTVVTWRNGQRCVGRVTAARSQGEDDVYQVRASGSLIRGNARHPFLVLRGETPEWVRLADLHVGDLLVQSANICSGTRQDFSEDEAWALGFTLGDGWVTKNVKRNKRPDGGRMGATASWVTWLGRYLVALSMSAGAKFKRVPQVMFEQAPHLQRAFLDGFSDADGHLLVRGNCEVKRINLCNRLLVDDLRHMARSLGYRVTNITEQLRKPTYAKPPYSEVAEGWFSATFAFHWRHARDAHFSLSQVKSIVPCGRAEVFDISVEGDGNFIADGLVAHNTRWHLDDPAGRLMEQDPSVRVCRYPAIAEKDEWHDDLEGKAFLRRAGEPLFPELKSAEFLEQQRRTMTLAGWQSIYQQSPILVGGDMFPIDKVKMLASPPARADVYACARYWDKAGTEGAGAYSAGVLMLRMRDGTFVIVDVRRGRWSALDRERMIKQTASIDRDLYPTCKIWVEQEPGSGGKESAEASVRMLAGFSAEADRVTGSKEVRADPFAAQWQAGNVRLVTAAWNRDYLDEHEHFPAGKHKDQVDASTGAFNKLASKYRYDATLSWVS